ncbi:MAG TPA: glycosyltransferase 87 family protein [Candidatus Sulfotelmatobacter sp.]
MNQAIESRLCVVSSETEHLLAGPAATRKNPDWLPAVEWCVVVILAAAFVGFTLVPGWQSLKSEFPNYYLAAELYHQGIPLDRVYEWAWFQRQNDHLQVRDGLVSFAPNPPTSILPLLPLTRLKPLAAKRVWMGLNLVLLALSLFALRQTTQLGWRRLILITLLCTLPLRVDFLFARYYVFILFLICTAYYAAYRNGHWAAGALWSTAAAMKLFPAIAVILFIRRRNWRALAGFVLGAIALVASSLALFGAEVHRVFLREVMTQASRGDWLGPYALFQNSFITLWSHLFLMEPELNPAPLVNSLLLYALAMAITVAALLFGFLVSMKSDNSSHSEALHWASLLPLMLLLSTYSSSDHACILIFTAIVGFDALLAIGRHKTAFGLLALYVMAAAPTPFRIALWLPHRLVGITALYLLLLYGVWDDRATRRAQRWWAVGLISVMVLAVYNLRLANHTEDFSQRVPIGTKGYRFANPVALANGVAFTDMEAGKYSPAILIKGATNAPLSMPGDALSLAGSPSSDALYAELATQKSFLVKLPTQPVAGVTNTIGEGQDPALSANGKWLVFIREEQGIRTAWLWATDSPEAPHRVLSNAYQPLDVTVTNDGDVIAAAGKVSDPHLLLVRHDMREAIQLSEFRDPLRYPAISPDGKRLAFSRREDGSWHLFARTSATGHEQQLTHAPCNAISPAWTDNHTLLYASDCGRGVGMSAIARVVLPD